MYRKAIIARLWYMRDSRAKFRASSQSRGAVIVREMVISNAAAVN